MKIKDEMNRSGNAEFQLNRRNAFECYFMIFSFTTVQQSIIP